MRTIGREAKQPGSDMDALKEELFTVKAENDALKKAIKKLEAEKKKSEKNASVEKAAQ